MAAVSSLLTALMLIAVCRTSVAQNPIVFCATRSTNVTTATNVVGFDNLTINEGNGFDLVTSTFTAPEGGYYWLSFSAAIQASVTADVRLVGAQRAPNILRESTSLNNGPDTTSRDELTILTAGSSKLTISSDGPLYSDAFVQVSFCGFQLDNIYNPTAAYFSVGLSTPKNTAGRIAFDQIIADTKLGWNFDNYLIPVEGTWVITLMAAHDGIDPGYTDLYASSLITRVYHYSNATGADTSGKTVILQLSAGTSVYAYVTDPTAYSDIRYQTSLLGFCYSPDRQLKVAWSVATESSIAGLNDPLGFDVVFINQGNGWNVATNIYTVPLAGTYYITWTAGIYSPYPTKLELVVNGVTIANVYRQATSFSNYDTRSRSIILLLAQDDQLKIRLPSGYRIYSNAQRITMFSGFRITV